MTSTHPSPYSGEWYPADPDTLAALLADRFAESEHRTGPYLLPGAFAYVVPHAGPAYSGTVAAAVYRSLEQQRPERIIVLAFPHRGGMSGVAMPDTDRIATPFGEVTLDNSFIELPRLPEEELCDHSFEIQLPFLQKSTPGSRITALYVGHMDSMERRQMAERLAEAWRPGTVFLASSDFTHYGRSFGHLPFPNDRDVADRLRELDFDCIDAAGSLDSTLFLDVIERRGANACGTAPIALLDDILRARGTDGVYQAVLDYQTSGEIEGDYRHSVSYAALGYYPRAAFEVGESDRAALLDAAEATLAALRRTGERCPVEASGSPALSATRAAFVTLQQGDELLGCVGNRAGRPLREEIGELTLAAALDDPRFRPAADHQGLIDIEISVLTPFRRIRDLSEFQVGKHGAMLRLGRSSGLLLPQVAAEHHWSADDFWRALARKSLLPPRAWCDPNARVEIFEAQVFGRRQPL